LWLLVPEAARDILCKLWIVRGHFRAECSSRLHERGAPDYIPTIEENQEAIMAGKKDSKRERKREENIP